MFTCTVKLNGSAGFTQPYNGTVVLVLVQSQMGNRFVDWSVRPHSSRRLAALFQLLRPFSACSTISVSERERAPGLDSGLETTFTWPRSHLGFNTLGFQFSLGLRRNGRESVSKTMLHCKFWPYFSISLLHQLSGLSYIPIHFLFFFVQFSQVVVNSDKQFLQSWSWVSLVPDMVSLDLGLALVLAVSWLSQSWAHQY